MLRDTLCALPNLGTWPCDEINYIWRYGNARFPTDELQPQQARPEVVAYIRQQFASIARAQNVELIVEKTCANTLRVPFVDTVLPEARYIHIVRDGRDVVASAMQRWGAPLNLPYVLRKARYVPVTDLPFYAGRYLGDRLHKFRSSEDRLGAWGPRFEGMREALGTLPLAAVCALQWKRSVDLATEALARLPAERVVTVQYEAFVADPASHLAVICGAAAIDAKPLDLADVTAVVSARSVGNWRRHLTADQVSMVEKYAGDTLDAFNYPRSQLSAATS